MRVLTLLILGVTLFGVACNRGPAQAPVLAEAFAGPAVLNIRAEISLRSPTVASVKHGDRIEIIQVRRRFARVRTNSGAEGWCEGDKLLSTEQMEQLESMNKIAAKLPVQAEAMVYDALNIHTAPNRQAPSFHQLQENDKVTVLGHKLAPRVPYRAGATAQLVKPPPKPERPVKRRKKQVRDDGPERPPYPPGPPAPANWLQISKRLPIQGGAAEQKAPAKPSGEPIRMEDWSLVRSASGRAGWVLTRALTMTIPDDVAQYAEGHRITSWFSLGAVTLADGTEKHHYVWTTIPKGGEEFEFDGVRVFIFNAKKNRYETAFRLRNLKGYYPSAAHPVEVTQGKKTLTVPGFSIVTEKEDGRLERSTYALEGYRVRLIGTSPWKRLSDPFDPKAAEIAKPVEPETPAEPGWWDTIKSKIPFLGGDKTD